MSDGIAHPPHLAIASLANRDLEHGLRTTLRRHDPQLTDVGRQRAAIVDDDGSVVGWGSLNAFNPRPAYDHVADFSVYVAREARGRGIGDALLSALENRAPALGYHKLALAAFPHNAAGMRLYERHGFTTVGTYREHGWLDGQWVDVIVMEKILEAATGAA